MAVTRRNSNNNTSTKTSKGKQAKVTEGKQGQGPSGSLGARDDRVNMKPVRRVGSKTANVTRVTSKQSNSKNKKSIKQKDLVKGKFCIEACKYNRIYDGEAMVRCFLCNENFHVDCIGVTVAETEGIWNCIHCRGVTNRVSEMHTLVKQFSDYIANVTTTNTDLVKELSRKIVECDELRSENDTLKTKLFTLEKEAEMLRIGQRKLTESAKTVNKNTQHWQTQTKKRPIHQLGQYNPTAELNTWQMTPKSVPLEECHYMSTPLVTSANMLGPWQAPSTTQVQHQQQIYIPESHIQQIPQQQHQVIATGPQLNLSQPSTSKQQAPYVQPTGMKSRHARSSRQTAGTTRYVNPTVPVYQHSRPPTMMTAQPRCFKCGEAGHMKLQCRHKEPIMCRSCGKFGHKSKFCVLFK